MDRNSADRCSRCGCCEIARDEVFHRGPVILAECRRCQQRWTYGAEASAAVPRRIAPVGPVDGLAA